MAAALTAATCLFVSPAAADKPPTGRFLGCVTSLGVLTPVVTRLTDQHRGIGGTFTYLDEGVPVDGTLEHIGVGDGLSYSMVWKDKYGSGELRIQFTADTNAFSGRWTTYGEGSQADSFAQFWSGQRSEAPLETAGCGQS